MRFFLCLIITFTWSNLKGQSLAEKAILEFNAASALKHLQAQNATDPSHFTLLSEAWRLYGNDKEEQKNARKALELSSSASAELRKFYEARVLQSKYKFPEASQLFLQANFDQLNSFQQQILLNALIENQADSASISQRLSVLMNNPEKSEPYSSILQGSFYAQSGNAALAKSFLEPLLEHSSPYVRLKAYLEIGRAQVNKGQFEDAIQLLSEGIDLAKKINSHKAIIDLSYQAAFASARSGKFHNAVPLTILGGDYAQQIGNKYWEYRINNIRAWSYFGTGEDFNNSLNLQRRQFELVNQFDNDLMTAGIYNNLGYDLTIAGTVPLDSTIQLMEITNDIYAENENSHGRWYSLMNLVWQTRLKGDFDSSIEYGRKSVIEGRRANDRHALVETLFQMGESLLAKNEIAQAKKYYDEANQVAGKEEDRDRYVNDVYYAHFLWKSDGSKTEAIELLENAVKFLETSEVFYEMKGRAYLASLYLYQNQISKARQQLSILFNPRSNYISFETRVIAGIVRSTIMANDGELANAKALLQSMHLQARQIGALLLEQRLEEAMNGLDK